MVMEIHRLSNAASTSRSSRWTELKLTEHFLDSAYRVKVAELAMRVSESGQVGSQAAAVFPVEPPPSLFVSAFADGSDWMIRSPVIHEFAREPLTVVIVPAGFVTDFASVPQPLQALRGVRTITSRYAEAALVHDYLYWRQDCTREQSDRIMEIALKEAGVSLIERKLIFEGLRSFAQSAWDTNRRARQSGLIRTVPAPYDQVPPSGTWAQYREWLRSVRVREGFEYRVPRGVCEMGNTSD